MSDEILLPIIDDMVWSYSRLRSFVDCPYGFYMKYICYPKVKEDENFYASYGSFVHKIIEEYYTGAIKKDDMVMRFLSGFQDNVQGKLPRQSTVNNYIHDGVRYFESFKPFPYKLVAVEKRFDFKIDDRKFTGRLDFIGRDDDGSLVIIDHKSRRMKPRSKRKKPTKTDVELDDMLKQLYIYSLAVKDEYGEFPSKLCFNCFRNDTFIVEPFNDKAYKDAIDWALDTIQDVRKCNDFYPNCEYFCCKNICGLAHACVYAESEFGN